MGEWIIIGVVSLSGILFAVGGTGFKWTRRFVMPVVLAIGAFLLGIVWWKCLVSFFLTVGAMHLGYGEHHPLWYKALTILSFALCLLPLASGLNGLLTLIVPLVFGTGYWLSRKYNWWAWKLTELATGGSLGFTVVLLTLTQ